MCYTGKMNFSPDHLSPENQPAFAASRISMHIESAISYQTFVCIDMASDSKLVSQPPAMSNRCSYIGPLYIRLQLACVVWLFCCCILGIAAQLGSKLAETKQHMAVMERAVNSIVESRVVRTGHLSIRSTSLSIIIHTSNNHSWLNDNYWQHHARCDI